MHDTQLEASSEAPYYVLLSFAAANRLGYGPDNARGILLMVAGTRGAASRKQLFLLVNFEKNIYGVY